MTSTRKPHPAEIAEREQAARCVEFWSFYFGGFGKREGGRFDTLAEAAADARAIEARNRTAENPRGAMVYGFTPERIKVFVVRELWPAHQEAMTMDERFEKLSVSQLVLCIEAVEGERPGKPNSKAAALKRLARGMAERGLDADEALNAAGVRADGCGHFTQNGVDLTAGEAGDVIAAMEAAILAADPDADPMGTLMAAEAARLEAERRIEAALKAPAEPTPEPQADDAAPEATPAEAEPAARRLPREGTKERTAYEMMRRPGGATNQELVAATGLRYSFAANGRRFAARYGLDFAASREGRTVRFQLHAAS